MAALNFRRRQTRRWWYAGATAAAAVFFAAFFVMGASANLVTPGFEGNDGNMVVNTAGNTDWGNVGGVSSGVDLPAGSTDNSFGQGTKEDVPGVTVVAGSIPPNKNDLTRFYEASQQGPNGHIYLQLAWERLVNIGNANIDFEINQKTTAGFTGSTMGAVTLNRTAGDLLVTYDFGGSGTPTLGLNTWLTAAAGNTVSQCFSANALPCWGKHITLNGTNSEGAVNTVAITDPLNSNASLGVGLFGEANIDLTASGVFPSGVCEAFGSVFAKSRSSSSFTAEIKDFIAPVPVSISNCGTITIHKVTENGTSNFGYTTTNLTPATFNLSNGQSTTYTGLKSGSYSVTENLTGTQALAGWSLKSLSCTPTGSGTSVTTNNGAGPTVTITMGLGGNVDCTYTNHLQLRPTLPTTPSAGGTVGQVTLNDSATVTGGSTNPIPTGTVTFKLYSPSDANCSGTPAYSQKVTLSGGSATATTSGGFLANAAGTWQWTADYSGDSNNDPASSGCGAEQVTVNPASPGIVTTPAPSSVTLGTTARTLNDSAVLSGGYNPQGTIAFTLVYNGTAVDTESVPVNGNGTYSTPTGYTLPTNATVTGTYQWNATYTSSNANNNTASEVGNAAERVTVSPASPTIVTSAGPTVTLGDGNKLTDTADLEGGYFPGGSITFTLKDPNGTVVDTEGPVTVNGNGLYTTPSGYTPTTTGTYHWSAVYTPDGNNNGANDPGTSAAEAEVVIGPNLTVTKTGDPAPVNSTDDVHFVVTITNTGAGSALNVLLSDPLPDSAHLTWQIKAGDPGSIDSNGVLTDNIGTLVSGGTVTIHVFAHTPAGYHATLPNTATVTSSNNPTKTDSATDTVLAPNLAITKTADNATVFSPAPVGFTITVSNNGQGSAYNVNLSDPLPTIPGVSWTTVTTTPSGAPQATLSGNNLTDALGTLAAGATITFHVTGTAAAGSGGFLNNAATITSTNNVPSSLPASASIHVIAQPQIITTASAPITLHAGAAPTISDTIVMSNLAPAPDTGSIIVTLKLGSTTVFTDAYQAANGTHVETYTLPTTGTVTGTYTWSALYAGDTNNLFANDEGGTQEQTVVSPSNPTLPTTPSLGGTVGLVTLNDSATVTGGYNPTGSVTFNLYDPRHSDCSGTPAYTQTVTLSGGSAHTSPGFLANLAGTWQWTASYSGDSNNNPASSGCGAEPVTVNPASPSGSTAQNLIPNDSFTLSGGFNPTGSITFTLFSPSDANCSGTPALTQTVTVTGNGTYSTSNTTFIATAEGTWRWLSTYSGDVNNAGTSSACGVEQFTIANH